MIDIIFSHAAFPSSLLVPLLIFLFTTPSTRANPAGTYSVTASASGYISSTQTGKIVVVNQTTWVNFNLDTLTLGEAVDDTSLIFTTGGNANWIGQTVKSYFGGDAAQSGTILNSGNTWMETTISGSGTLSFYWKVSSEVNYDFLEFYIDNKLQNKISGNIDWQRMNYTIRKGKHTLRWRYVKDESVSVAPDAGWVDKVELIIKK